MKMTRLEWRYLQKIALDHPYFDTHELPLTEKEAEAIVKANIRMTGREFVDSIYAQLGMTRPSEEKKPFAWLRSIGEQFTIPPIRKIIIAALIVVLLTAFFAATPMGQAIAESIIHYLARIDGNRFIAERNDHDSTWLILDHHDEAVESEQQALESDYVYVNSFDEFAKTMGKTPFKLPLPYTELYYEYDEVIEYLVLYVIYDAPDGKIITYQIWGAEDLSGTTLTDFKAYGADQSIFFSIEEEGKISIYKVYDDTILHLSSRGNYSLEKLINMLKNG